MALPKDSYLRFGPYLDLMTGIRTALNINEGIIKVVAPEGCGKSSLCRQLEDDLAAEGHDVIFFEIPPESVEFLHKRIQSELDLPRDKNFTRSLTQYLLAKKPPNHKLIIIYDDAEKISKEIFILIRLLNNVHDTSDTLVSQVICGTPKLDKVFDDPDLRSLTQYLNQSFTLNPMTREELNDFCSGYKKLVGKSGMTLSNKVLTDIFMVGKGIPGKTLELLEKHLAAASDAKPVPVEDKLSVPELAELAEPVEPDALAEAVTEAAPAQDVPASLNVRKVKEIPGTDIHGTTSAPPYFKIVLGVMVLFAMFVLTVLLSGDNEAINNRLASILSDDSTINLDEVEPGNNQAAPSPVQPEPVQTETAPEQTARADTTIAETSLPDAQAGESLADANLQATEITPEESTVINDATSSIVMTSNSDKDKEVMADTDSSLFDTLPAEESVSVQNVLSETDISARPEPEVVTPSRDELLQTAIQDWVGAWQAGNYAGYLAAYHDNFEPTYHDTRQAWESERESRIDGVPGISVRIDRFEQLAATSTTTTVRFWLHYARGNYADETLKEVRFQQSGDRWLILEERNMELIVR